MRQENRIKKLESLTGLSQNSGATNNADELVLCGFDDVRDWLEGKAKQPDPHRVNDIIRLPMDLGTQIGDVPFFESLREIVLGCILQRAADLGAGELNTPDAFNKFLDQDYVATAWEWNSALSLEASKAGRSNHLKFRGESGPFIGLRVGFHTTSECTPGCRWYKGAED